ncbi:conserved hypothetical protein [Candida albicans WO-1]|uniref:Uncharacterized protein n=1 Tax=Candida albicans (strain WO-1) TaxID=294748 RepID=C4YTC1_CANAW|nr:conserved hypothetical protein [Candida albicans WO-1]
MFSLTIIVPFSINAERHLLQNSTNTSSGNCPTHHWHQINQYECSGCQSCIPISYIFPNLPLFFTSVNSLCICATKGLTGSNKSTESSTFQSKSRVILPMPAPISIVVLGTPSGHVISVASLRKNVEDPTMSALGTEVCSPYPPSTPSTDAGVLDQY